MKYAVYLTFYKGEKLPLWYIGSSTLAKLNNGYNGSVTSKKYKEIYKKEQKENKHLFKTRILSYHETRKEAYEEELRLQKKHKVVKNERYFNESYAKANGYFGRQLYGENNPMFGNNKVKGGNILIFNDKDEIIYTISDSKQWKQLPIPEVKLKESLQLGGKPLYMNKLSFCQTKFPEFRGYYALREGKKKDKKWDTYDYDETYKNKYSNVKKIPRKKLVVISEKNEKVFECSGYRELKHYAEKYNYNYNTLAVAAKKGIIIKSIKSPELNGYKVDKIAI